MTAIGAEQPGTAPGSGERPASPPAAVGGRRRVPARMRRLQLSGALPGGLDGRRPAVRARTAPAGAVSARTQQLRWACAAVSALALWGVAFVLVFSAVQEQRAQRSLFATFRQELASGTAPLSAPVAPGAPVALVSIPAVGLRQQVVVEGTRSGDLRSGPGHLPGTVLPGQQGLSVIAGRALSFGGPFRDLAALRPGDAVDVVTGSGAATYRVDRLRRSGEAVPAAPAAGSAHLSLVTLAAGHWSSGLTPGHVLVVDATLVGQATPAGAVAAYDPSGRPGARDSSALTELVLLLELLLAVALGLVWGASRWGGLRTWVVGAPPLLAVLWTVSSVASRLLPNVY